MIEFHLGNQLFFIFEPTLCFYEKVIDVFILHICFFILHYL